MCLTNDGIEDTEFFLLKSHAYDNQRRDLFGTINEVLQLHNIPNLPNHTLHTLYYLVVPELPIIKIEKF